MLVMLTRLVFSTPKATLVMVLCAQTLTNAQRENTTATVRPIVPIQLEGSYVPANLDSLEME